MVLVGDIGGTKTVLAAAVMRDGRPVLLNRESFASADYPGLDAVARTFLARHELPYEGAVFGVAGPVRDQRCTATNLPWLVEAGPLAESLNLPGVLLLNDLQAMAYAIPHLAAGDLRPLNAVEPDPGGPISVLAPGTGLGEAFLVPSDRGYRAYPSEGGHADLAPSCREDVDLVAWLMDRYEHVSYERVCSGLGTALIYRFLKETGRCEEPPWLGEQLAHVADPVPVIDRFSQGDEACPICRRTMDLFIRLLGAKAGNLALGLLPTGGLYLGGGIPPKMINALADGRFMAAFMAKGRMSGALGRIPVRVVMNPHTPLLGAACHGLDPDAFGGKK